ncbi:MAG: tyrosine recombinase XerC [Lawsonibacter sp.]|nr:tyrosine recombinase XerC [Lawsonibacter sp.]
MTDYRTEAPPIIRDFLVYHETIQNHSKKTVDEYFLDLRNFFRYLKVQRRLAEKDVPMDSISIDDVDLELVSSVTLTDVYNYMSYLSRDRAAHPNSDSTSYGLAPSARARKIATIRSFYKYLTVKAKLMKENPMQDLDSPRLKKALPRYLDLDESIELLDSVEGKNSSRDYCILTLFLNCGLRISELVGLNVTDVREGQLRVLGKGNKERILYLNEACQNALQDWLTERSALTLVDRNALFVTLQNRRRISTAAVHKLVKKHLAAAGLDSSQYSSHKLRHTAATLMLQNGVDVRTLQEVLGHDNLNTTQIYTHIDSENLRTAARANPLAKVRKSKKTAPKEPDSQD